MYKFYKYISFILITTIVVSCSAPKPSIDDITGVWESVDGGSFKFNKNGEVEIKDYPL